MVQVFQNFRVGRGGHRWLFKINRSLACYGIGYKLRDKYIKREDGRSGKREVLTNEQKKRGHIIMAPCSA